MSKKKHKHKTADTANRSVTFHGSVLQSIRQHARRSPGAEICGALIGRLDGTGTTVIGAVPGEGAAQGGAHVTFTQEAWVRIHEEKDRKYSGQAIVGWYHSHPGFGVFLSDHDTYIHKHFFSSPGSLAWVYDPHSDEEGCFGWNAGEVRRLDRYSVVLSSTKDTGPRSEPTGFIPAEVTEHGSRFAARLPPRMRRRLLMSGLTILIVVLVSIGGFAFRRSALLDHARERFRHWQAKRSGESGIPPPQVRDGKSAPARSRGHDVSAEIAPVANGGNRTNQDGGRNEQ
jgi:proteasome lid subunit RPN8/RPN11